MALKTFEFCVSSNKIMDFHGMMFLGLCHNLRVLDMTNNSITQKENYRQVVRTHIPNLSVLDQKPYNDVSEAVKIELSRSEYRTAEHSSNIIRELNSIQNNLHIARPSTVPPVTHITIATSQRATTADKPKLSKSHNLSVGEPVCGNIVAKARQPRKLKTAWGDSASSSSSFSSSDSSNQATPLSSARSRCEEESSDNLLESARIWRENSRETREKFNDV